MDLGERVTKLEICQARIEERVEDLESYKKKQNGSIQRLEQKMDDMNKWLIGLLGGVIASLVLLLVNISMGR